MRRKLFGWAAIFTVIAVLGSIFSVIAPQRAEAANPNDFNPGYIISDQAFFNASAMNASGVQSFLNSKGGTCASGFTCLKDYSQATNTIDATANCNTYNGAGNESAATIIAKVSAVCGINPQVLLVLLQKEQGLVTATSPSDLKFKIAMGYACPDTAACDQRYYGFHNQVYSAASQFKQYTRLPNRQYKIGNVAIQYHPNAACGSSVVNIQNQATANLYNYTPYQPNAAAMANLGGSGDSCSAYGNRNFWRYFSDWFGSPTGNINPVSNLDSVSQNADSIRLTGWTFDPDTQDSLDVHVYVDGAVTGHLANGNRPDVAGVYGNIGNAHGFDITVPVTSSGSKNVCLYAINKGPGTNGPIGTCRTVVIPPKTPTGATGSPIGSLDAVSVAPGTITVEGWSIDPDTTGSIGVHVYANKTVAAITADVARNDVAAAYPGFGAAHGYSTVISVAPGRQEVCAYGINEGGGTNKHLGCRTVTVPNGNPFGSFDALSAGPGVVNVAGWAVDPNSNTPLDVHIYVDNIAYPVSAFRTRDDVARSYPWWGNDVGFEASIPTPPGNHNICTYGINVGAGTANTHLGCKSIWVP